MSAVTRWVEYLITDEGRGGDGNGSEGLGTRGYTTATAAVGDTFNIGSSNNKLYIAIDGDSSSYVTLTEGTALDPRFVARDITEKIHNLGKVNDAFDQAQCVWENNKLKLYSGTTGSSSSATVATSGTDTAHTELGWGTATEVGGAASTNVYSSAAKGVVVTGTYNGLFDEIYKIVISKDPTVGVPSKDGSNTYTGTMTVGGVFNNASDLTYTIGIDITNGTTMGGGTGNVPKMSWTSTGDADNSAADVELLYADYWYKVGTKGLMVKFTDAVFNTVVSAWTVACTAPAFAEGSNVTAPAGTAQYVWSGSRGDDTAVALTTSDSAPTRLGSRGLYIQFLGTGNFTAGDEFYVVATPAQPQSVGVSNLNYGNVTVSTESPVKCVMFEILSGAVGLSTVKFGLQSHGTFSHHEAGNTDTLFRFGTVGGGNTAGTSPLDGYEHYGQVTAASINSDTPPSYLYATRANLPVVVDADDSQSVGSCGYAGMTSDLIYINVKLGASEVGANSGINYRVFFDYF